MTPIITLNNKDICMARNILRWFNLGLPFHRVAFWISFIISILLIIAGFICPPVAEVASSVLIACGILFGYAALGAAIKAIEDGKEVEIKNKDIKVTVGDAGEHFDNNHGHHGRYDDMDRPFPKGDDGMDRGFLPKPEDDDI